MVENRFVLHTLLLMVGAKDWQQLRQLLRVRWTLMLNTLGYSQTVCERIQHWAEQGLREVDLHSRCRVYHLRSRRGVRGFLVLIAPMHPIELRTTDIVLLQTYLQQLVSEQLFLPSSALRMVVNIKPNTHQRARASAPQTLGVPLQDVVRTCIGYQYSTSELQKLFGRATGTAPTSPFHASAVQAKCSLGATHTPDSADLESGDYPVLTSPHIPKPSAAWLDIP
ncbi:hypothetical protein [Rhodoferax aquaticus]|uniref:Uncharacterized protein n=1 Tax=Rhodoferax aquaticus TaxID=2527691 RepID=A0A515ESA7_9BURK|nr:hypothetical protein [Rhodoferax aquaticus]QDL55544.1 hypothetical protein EXZ61_15925 [Rhodoferax aquaticus]